MHLHILIAARDEIQRQHMVISARLSAFPRRPDGLTLDSAKTPEWRALRAEAAALFSQLRQLNARIVKAGKAKKS